MYWKKRCYIYDKITCFCQRWVQGKNGFSVTEALISKTKQLLLVSTVMTTFWWAEPLPRYHSYCTVRSCLCKDAQVLGKWFYPKESKSSGLPPSLLIVVVWMLWASNPSFHYQLLMSRRDQVSPNLTATPLLFPHLIFELTACKLSSSFNILLSFACSMRSAEMLVLSGSMLFWYKFLRTFFNSIFFSFYTFFFKRNLSILVSSIRILPLQFLV